MQPQPNATEFEITLLRDHGTIALIQTNGNTGAADGVDLDFGVWQRMLPHAARDCRGIYRDLADLRDGDAVVVPGDDHVRSLFGLATTLSCCAASPLVSKVSEAWMRLPLRLRCGWWHKANSDKPIHAQIMGAQIGKMPFDASLPTWLPSLIEATDRIGRTADIYWSYAHTPLGMSCVAYLDDEPENQHACMALSSCAIAHNQVDCKGRLLARRAVDDLIQRSEMLTGKGALADAIGWETTGHELLHMRATLDAWRERVDA